MHEQLLAYFQGEKEGGLFFGLAGVVAIGIALLVYRSAYRPMIYPLLIIAAIELGVCGAMQLRTDSRVARLSAQLRDHPVDFHREELARLRGVNLSFRIIEVVELLLFVCGVVLALSRRQAPCAVGLGLILQSSAMLVCDIAAERRAHRYSAALIAHAPRPDT